MAKTGVLTTWLVFITQHFLNNNFLLCKGKVVWTFPIYHKDQERPNIQYDCYIVIEPQHDKPTIWPMHPAKTQINLGIWVGSYGLKVSSCGQRRLWSDWADAQADLSLRWAHMSFWWFCHAAAQLSNFLIFKEYLLSAVSRSIWPVITKYWDGQIWRNSVDPDQTALKEQSDQDQHYLPFSEEQSLARILELLRSRVFFKVFFREFMVQRQYLRKKKVLDHLSRNMTKPTKWLCAQRQLRSAWSYAQSDQRLSCGLHE